MTPAMCRVKHDPPTSYGDCLRACIATVMDLDTDDVPHFADLGASAEEAITSARQWLASRRLTVATFALPGDVSHADVMQWMADMNPTVTWLLFGQQRSGGDHVVVCQGGEMVHNPAWIPSSIVGPTSAGIWQIWVICRV